MLTLLVQSQPRAACHSLASLQIPGRLASAQQRGIRLCRRPSQLGRKLSSSILRGNGSPGLRRPSGAVRGISSSQTLRSSPPSTKAAAAPSIPLTTASPLKTATPSTSPTTRPLTGTSASSSLLSPTSSRPSAARGFCSPAFPNALHSSASPSPSSSSTTATMADRDILPGTVKPVHYDLLLTDLEFKDWTYKGTVKIDAKLTQASSEIVINTWDVKLHNANVSVEQTKAGQTFESTDFVYDTKKQRTTIRFKEQLPASAKAQIVIDFEAIINHDMSGFYRSQYKPPKDTPAAASVPRDEDFHYMMSTQFEACDARRAFPCFDEPNLKATFDVALEIPDDQVALSNMPVKEEKPGNKSGTKLVTFERTPVMSTYLLAWAIGDFEYIEALTDRRYNGKQIPVRVYTTRGLIEQGRWALQHAPKYIDFFSEKFEIDYPLPKSDILAVHEFTHGAMENWGLVTYRTTAILFDEKQSDAVFRNRIAYVVAHELAHQWFGNLVTMDWWDELWLNEGFATWAGWVATEHLHPDWDVWAQWVNEGMETALGLDAVRASHPIHVPVRDALDVNQVFDAISYLKGCSVIRMLANHLGTETFLKGVAIYLKKNKYGNATTQDLWAGLSEASGQDINTIMGPWVEKIGHPVLTVAEEPGQITVKQSRFLSTGDVEAKDDTTTWWVPLSFEGKVGTQGIDTIALTTKEETIRDVNDDFYKLNSNATGFYRVSYPPARLAKLGTQLDRLSVADKIATAGSAAELAFSGYGTTPALLSFVQGFSGESHYRVLSQALDAVGTVKGIFGEDDDIRKVLERFILELIERPLSTIGWDFPEGEDFNKGLLRKRLLLAAGVNGHTGVQEEALRRFRALRQDPANNRPHPDLRRPIYRVALKADPADTVAFLQDEWRTSNAPDGREVSLATMGHVFDAGVVTRTLLPFLFGRGSDCVPAGDMHYLASGLAHNRVARPLLWQYMRENWGEVVAKVGGNPVVLDRLVKVSLQQFSDRGALASIEDFFADKDTGAFNRTLETVKDRIRGRAAYRERDAGVLREWAAARGAA